MRFGFRNGSSPSIRSMVALPPFRVHGRNMVNRRRRPPVELGRTMAPTQDALYRELDLDLSWSESDLPERERTKHVHRLHPYLGKFVPQLVEALIDRHLPRRRTSSIRSPARGRRSSSRSRAVATRPASTWPPSTACSCASRRPSTTCSRSSTSCATRSAGSRPSTGCARRGRTPTSTAGSRRRPPRSSSSTAR